MVMSGSAETSALSLSQRGNGARPKSPTANEHWTRSRKVQAELNNHKPIKFRLCQSLYLFWQHLCCGTTFCCSVNLRKEKKLYNLFLEGQTKLEKELDVVKLLKRLRHHDIALKASILCDSDKREQVKHARKNLIDIDSSEESDKSGFTEISFDAAKGKTYEHHVVNGLTKQVVQREGKCKQVGGMSMAASENVKVTAPGGSDVPVHAVYQI